MATSYNYLYKEPESIVSFSSNPTNTFTNTLLKQPRAGLFRGDLVVHTLAAFYQQIQGSLDPLPADLSDILSHNDDAVGAIASSAAAVSYLLISRRSLC